MDILYVILTALLVVAAVTMILKKVDTRLTFLFLGVIGLAAATIVTGQSVLGDSTTGNVWLDIFDVIRAKFVSTISGTGIRLMMIGGYVMLMNHTKAADVLALGASKLLKPIKNPYIVLALVYMIGAVLKIFITSQIALGLLFMATMFPILTRLGVSKLSAAAACVAIGGMDLGPNDSTGIFAATEILNCTPMDWFTNYELIIGPVIIVCVGIFMGIWFQYMDKKEFGGLVIPEEAKEDMKISDLGVPAFYGVFPLIPLTLVVVFSFVDGIKMDVITAHIICFFLFFIVDLIVKKDMNRLQDNLKKLWVWMGNYFNNIIVLISVASVFAEAIKKLKGIDVLCGMLSHIGGAVIIVAIAMAAIQIGTALLTGSSNAPWYAFGSMGADMAATLGVHNGLLLVPMHLTGGLSRCFSPFCGAMIAVSGMVETEPMALCKRNAVPMLFGVLVCFIATFVVFGL